MRTLLLVIISISLGSCVTYNGTSPNVIIQKSTCPLFQLPDPTPVPQISELSESTLKDRHLSEKALLDVIVEHRRYIRSEREIINEAYIAYLKACN